MKKIKVYGRRNNYIIAKKKIKIKTNSNNLVSWVLVLIATVAFIANCILVIYNY